MKSRLHHDKPEFNFAISRIFEEDEAILEYMLSNWDKGAHRVQAVVDVIERI